MHHFVEKTEKAVLWVLTLLLLAGVVLGTVALASDFVHVLLMPPVMMIKPDTMFHMFGEFLVVLIGIKLIRLVLLSLPGGSSPIPAVIDVAMIGLGQKVVTMDVKTQPASTLIGVAALILALAVAAIAFRQPPQKDSPVTRPPTASDPQEDLA